MKPEYFQQLYAYHYALYDRIWKSIMQLSDEQFLQDTGYSLGSLRNHMVHMMNVDERWFARIRQRPVPEVLDSAPFTTRALVHEYWDRVQHDVLAFVAGVDEALLQEQRHYETRGGQRSNYVWQIMAHVVNHGTDHRAQILQILHGFGAPTFEQDLMIYLWG